MSVCKLCDDRSGVLLVGAIVRWRWQDGGARAFLGDVLERSSCVIRREDEEISRRPQYEHGVQVLWRSEIAIADVVRELVAVSRDVCG